MLICRVWVNHIHINALFKDSRCYCTAENIVNLCSRSACWCFLPVSLSRHINRDTYIVHSLSSVCVSSSICCSSTCRSGITEAKKAVGCCVNLYNTSDFGDRHTVLSLTVCGSPVEFESPGFCESPLSLSSATSTMERAVIGMVIATLTAPSQS